MDGHNVKVNMICGLTANHVFERVVSDRRAIITCNQLHHDLSVNPICDDICTWFRAEFGSLTTLDNLLNTLNYRTPYGPLSHNLHEKYYVSGIGTTLDPATNELTSVAQYIYGSRHGILIDAVYRTELPIRERYSISDPHRYAIQTISLYDRCRKVKSIELRADYFGETILKHMGSVYYNDTGVINLINEGLNILNNSEVNNVHSK